MPTGQRYTEQKNARTRAAWPIVQRHCPTASKEACQQWVERQIGRTLESRPYKDSKSRKDATNPTPDRGLWRIEKADNVVPFPGTEGRGDDERSEDD